MIPEAYRSVDGAVFVHDPETGEILDVNETACELYGYSRAEARQLSLEDLSVGVPPYTRSTAVEYLQKAAVGNPQELDWRAKDGEGNHFPVELSMRRTVIGGRTCVVVIARDITERTRHERALERLHATTRELLTAESPTEIASLTCEATTEILGLPLVGVHLYDDETDALVPVAWSDALASVLNDPPPSIPAERGLVWRAYERREPHFYADVREVEGVLETRTLFRSELHLPLGEHGVIIVGSTSVDDFDVTDKTLAKVWAANVEAALDRIERERDRRCYEKQLQRTTEELEALNRVVQHDIRNDMSVILGWAEHLEGYVDDEGREHLRRILTSGEHVVELTETAREYIEMLTNDGELTVAPTPLQSTFETELSLRRESFPEAEFVLVSDVPRVAVQANEMLGTVFRNLLNNAVQHNDADDPRVWISCEMDDEHVRIRIADNGPGIPENRTESIFGKGDRGLGSAGSGIGLYLVQTLLDQYRGSVAVEANDPEGAVFTVQLRKAE